MERSSGSRGQLTGDLPSTPPFPGGTADIETSIRVALGDVGVKPTAWGLVRPAGDVQASAEPLCIVVAGGVDWGVRGSASGPRPQPPRDGEDMHY